MGWRDTQGGTNVGVKTSDQQGAYIQTRKGLRQGDPLSPILFNIVVDMLAVLIARAKDESQIEGIIPHLVDDGLSILQYANDTVIFLSHDMDKAFYVKFFLCVFEQLSGLKINYHKINLLFWQSQRSLNGVFSLIWI